MSITAATAGHGATHGPYSTHNTGLAASPSSSATPSPPPAEAGPNALAPDRPYQKRIRLSVACNQCRKRKVRCDTSLPKCKNCVQRNEHCETSDLRRPDHGPGVRTLAIAGLAQQAQQQQQQQQQQQSQPRTDNDLSRDGHSLLQHERKQSRPTNKRSLSSISQSSQHDHRNDMGSAYEASPLSVHNDSQTPLARPRAATTSSATPDSRRFAQSPAPAVTSSTPSSTSTSQPGPDLTWVQRAYRVVASAAAKNSTLSTTTHHCNAEPIDSSTPDVVVNTDDSHYRVKFTGGSSLQSLCTFLDLHLISKGIRPISPGFRTGMQYTEEFALPLTPHLPTLPPREELDGYVASFMSRIWPLYPVVEPASVATDIDYLLQVQSMHGDNFARKLPQLTLPTLAVTYAILALGSAELAGQATPLSTSYLTAAYSLYGHLIALPYTVSVQALLLITLALRAQMRDGQAWQVLGQALRIAYSIGLHRTAPKEVKPIKPIPGTSPSYQADAGLHSRLWWSLYALERLVQLESGRPGIVHDRVGDGLSNIDSDPTTTANGGSTSKHASAGPKTFLDSPKQGHEYFIAWVELAHIMGKISDQFYGQKPRNSVELFMRVWRIDGMLKEWEEGLSEGVKVRKDGGGANRGRDGSQGSNGSRGEDQIGRNTTGGGGEDDEMEYQHHLASFLSLHYLATRITLLRIALIFPHTDWQVEISKQRPLLPSDCHTHLVSAADVCLSSARTIVTQATTLADEGERSTLLGANPMFMSAMILALGILRDPKRRLARADLQLFHLALEVVEEYLTRWTIQGGGGMTGEAATPGGQTSGGGSSGNDLFGLVALVRDQIDAYHAHLNGKGSSRGSTSQHVHGNHSHVALQAQQKKRDQEEAVRRQEAEQNIQRHEQQQQQQQQQMQWIQAGGMYSGVSFQSPAPIASTPSQGSGGGNMLPPPPPPPPSHVYNTSPSADDMSGVELGPYASSLMGGIGGETFDFVPFVDSTAGLGGGGGGEGSVGGMDGFEGLAFDELWTMIGTGTGNDYLY